MSKSNNTIVKLIPIMLAFFAMGFVDLVGTATNYVKDDLQLSDTMANIFPSMVFFWFLICSVPTGMLMNRIGRRKTVLLSLVVTTVSLLLPIVSYSFISMLLSFSLLGIGNALMQVSLNPLLSNVVSGDRLASSLTFGQFVKAIASFIAPLIASWGALQFDNWRILFPIFMVVAILAVIFLGMTNINEDDEKGESSTFAECFTLLGDKLILLSFLGIMCHVGIDVGTNVTAPKILIERLEIPLNEAIYATSVYFLFRTIGCFSGTFILAKFSSKIFFGISSVLMLLGMAGLFFFDTKMAIYACVALIGFGNSNIFPVIFSGALLHLPNKKNEVSGLMIMGLFGGTIFPLIMGVASDAVNAQIGAVAVMMIGVLYLLYFTTKIKK
ncbi:MFS transporter [Bacteroides sp. 224]|uniref:MFS transporter n=1 Tax=Bacteroides sp. 224 TaxID=2302936 RepID=UPI0013D63714|nr:MFS transporter [Bacteroides sp. 224]NDV65430.1 MFS transporter [Bacteroides sp. 224]